MAEVLESMYKRYTLYGVGESRPFTLTDGATTSLPLYGEHIHAEFPIVTFGWDRGTEGLTTLDRLIDRSHPSADPFSVVVYFTNPSVAQRNNEFRNALSKVLANSNIMVKCELKEPLRNDVALYDTAVFDTDKWADDNAQPVVPANESWYMYCDVTSVRPLRNTPARPDVYTIELTLDPETPWYKWCRFTTNVHEATTTQSNITFTPATPEDEVYEFTGGNEFVLFHSSSNSTGLEIKVYEEYPTIYNGELVFTSSATALTRWTLSNVKGYEGVKAYEDPQANPDALALRNYYGTPPDVTTFANIRIPISKLRVSAKSSTPGVTAASNLNFRLWAKSYRMGL